MGDWMPELTKEELSIKLCDLLEVQVDFSPMKREDLIKLYDHLSKLLRPISDMSIREFFEEVFGGEGRIRERIIPRARMRLRQMLARTEEKKEETKTET
jgi:hypothetical protein